MDGSYQQIADLITRVRARWRWLLFFRASVTAALTAAVVLLVALGAARFSGRSPKALAAIGLVGALVALLSIIRALWPVRRLPTDKQVARFIEEREPSLDDRLVTAVDVVSSSGSADATAQAGPAGRSGLAAMMLADADRRASAVDPSTIVQGEVLRRAGFQAAGALLALAAIVFLGRSTARQSVDALSLALFPSRVTLEVKPGNARLQVGTPLTIEARLLGNQTPVAAQLERAGQDGWIAAEMPQDESGVFRASLDSVAESFKYRVVAGGFTSPSFDITVARPPRITRIDLEYKYPDGLGLQPRKEEDSGDIYAPAGTNVRLLVHTDREVASGEMSLGGGQSLGLSPARATPVAPGDGGAVLEGTLTVQRDDSYRVRIVDREGLSAPGETEYFIRMLNDRPPEVRVLKPARDRNVTRLEEVDVEAEAQDDFGIEHLDLVYSVRGGTDQIVPLDIPRRAATVTGAHTIYLEDLNVKPGDFVSYYVRARDLARGRRSSEARSDIFFLEVKPFEQEFTLAQSQAMGAGGSSPQLDDLVSAQKEIIVATWKLDRRVAAANGARSDQDIKSVGRAEAELKTRVEETSSSFRESTMRDPRRRQRTPGAPRAGQTMPEEDAMTAAALAMGRAVGSLQALKTKDALPPELEALNHLLRAQGQVKERQVTRQTGSGTGGANRSSQDLSSLFDKELQRHQETNYETPTSSEQKGDPESSTLDKIRELAQRQDELLRRQQELARQRQKLSADELKRALESLTREQSELRQRAEEMAREMSRQGEPSDSNQKDQQGSQSQAGQRNQPGQQSGVGQGQSGKQSQSGQSRDGQQASASTRSGDNGNRMRDVSEEMRSAASELRREDPTQATERGNRALEKLRELEKQLQSGAPDERRRAMGDMQLEARQLADGQRQVSSELGRVGQGDEGRDGVRRLAGEQERLAERVQRLQKNLDRQASAAVQPGRPGAKSGSADDAATAQRAAGDASREIDRQRLGERMRQSAAQMRAAAEAGAKEQAGQAGSPRASGAGESSLKGAAGAQEEIARSLDRLADKLGEATGPRDDASKKLSGQMARAQELRERMEAISRKLEQLGQAGGRQGGQQDQQDQQGSKGSQTQRGNQAGRPGAKPGEQSGGQQNSQSQSGQGSGEQLSGQSGGQSGQGSAPDLGPGGEVARLRNEYSRQLQETRDLLDELRRDDRTFGHGGAGFTFEGQGMTLSAPGTESFKQDFAKWDELRKQATQALELAESSIAKKLQTSEARDRLASGVDDRPPAEYTQQVDSYFKALAGKKSR